MSQDTKEFVLAYCGLVCSQCGAYLNQRCRGCYSDKPMSLNCKVKPCAQEKNYSSCAECKDFADFKKCKKLNNWISKIFGFIFRTDRIANLNQIREIGLDRFKKEKQA